MKRRELPPQPRPRERLAVAATVTLALLAALSLLMAACGGGASSPSVASLGKTTGTTVPDLGANVTTPPTAAQYQQALKFSQCMRAHGIGEFPDPGVGGGIQASGAGHDSNLNPNNRTFSAAQKACQKFSPGPPSAQQQAQTEARGLAFSACMRRNGVASFPDPQLMPGGRLLIRITSNVDANSPTFKAAQQKCIDGGG
jgi:hypothetical protein